MIKQPPQTIFLSYRRSDAPGYVARLGDDLIDEYGDIVFRDVDSILGGDEWKIILKRQIAQSHIVLAIIGPRWLPELQARVETDVDYVRYELNTAKELKIPIIPVLVGNTIMPKAQLLGDLAWLSDRQQFTLLDEQNRWTTDSKVLLKRVGGLSGITPIHQADEKDKKPIDWKNPKWLIGTVAVLVLLMILTLLLPNGDTTITVDTGVGGQDVTTGDVTIGVKP